GVVFRCALLGTAAASAAPCDLSSDDAVLAAFEQATGTAISTYGGTCIRRSSTFPTMIAVGQFASDVGCEWYGAFHGCAWNDKKAATFEMAAAGWAKADAKRRTQLALSWLREVDQLEIEGETASARGGGLVIEFFVPVIVSMTAP